MRGNCGDKSCQLRLLRLNRVYGSQIGSFHVLVRDQAERAIQPEFNSIPAYEHRSRSAKAHEIPTFDAHPADKLHHFSSVGHDPSLTPP
jgi:hypothetical protein